MVLSFIMGLAQPLIAQMHFTGSGEITLNQMISMCLVCGLLAYIVWRAPAVAADLLAASPSLSAGAVGQAWSPGMSTGVGAFSRRRRRRLRARRQGSQQTSAASQMLRKTFGGRWRQAGRRWRRRRRPLGRSANASRRPWRRRRRPPERPAGGTSSPQASRRQLEPQGLGRPPPSV